MAILRRSDGAVAALLVLVWSGPARADVVLDWNGLAAQVIVGPGGANKVPPLGLVDLAIVHTAIYDAVNAVEAFPFAPYGVQPAVTTPASAEAAAARAGRDVLLALYPSRSADIEALYASSLAAVPDGPAETNGIDVGQQAAAGILALRANDGRNAGTPIVEPPEAPGVWIRTPPGFLAPQAPWAGSINPWTLNSSDQFRPEPPPELDSDTWVRDYNEVKALGPGTDSTRTAEQTDIARFWADQPMLQWNRAWRGISTGAGLSVQDNARLFAMLATASSDSLIACWEAKYHYMFWRPVTAIRAGGGNPELADDPSWLGLVPTPNHPEYPAAHGCFSGASVETLSYFFRTDDFTFTITSNFAGVTTPVRTYSSFSQALQEVADARIYGGMHYRSSTHKGAIVGKQVSHFATRHFFRRQHGN
jgi:PAP2 superfamily protein